MQANAMLYKVVPQRAGGYNILCGFNPKLVFATAERVTSAVHTLTTAQAAQIALQHALDLNAADVVDCTTGAVYKKLLKNEEEVDNVEKSFAAMGISQYM